MKNSIEERILSNRRALAADCPGASTHLDGAGMMEEEEKLCNRPNKRARHEDEDEMESKTFQRLQKLEALFGCSASVLLLEDFKIRPKMINYTFLSRFWFLPRMIDSMTYFQPHTAHKTIKRSV